MVSLQSNMQMQHDELAALFSRNLTFNPELQHHEQPSSGVSASQHESNQPAQQPIIYSVSQHYTHSAHVVKPRGQAEQETPRRSSEPPQTETLSPEFVLRNYGIDPNTLTPSQIQLFRIADMSQQERLIELWSICPPSNSGDIPALAWSSTTLEQETQLAQMRYERSNQEQSMGFNGDAVQTGDGRWTHISDTDSEPYMTSGYEELMRREQEKNALQNQPRSTYSQATDPVYMGPDYARQQQELNMANQYGAFQQFYGSGGADGMDVV